MEKFTIEDYNDKLKKLKSDFEKSKIDLAFEYVKANNPHKIGEMVVDHIGCILIEKIGVVFGYFNEVPYATYFGVEINKNGEPNKRGNKRTIHQTNLR